MPQVDNRNSSATKRARTDGGRRDDDWTCPSCNNVNYSFRTICNMHNCTQPRPDDYSSRSAAKPLQTQQSYSSSNPYVGLATPTSMYVGVRPYGSPMFNGMNMPSYDVTFSGGATYPYNYGNHIPGGSPYQPLHLSNTAPYSGGSMMGNGGVYGVPSLVERYGLSLSLAPAQMGPRPGFTPNDIPQRKDGGHDNDWTCPKCKNVNFSFRTVCNMRKCNTPKPGSQGIRAAKTSKPEMPQGSWKCEKCNNINYPFRTKCNRQNCDADKPSDTEETQLQQVDENDQ